VDHADIVDIEGIEETLALPVLREQQELLLVE
jgi:hypothetical protein